MKKIHLTVIIVIAVVFIFLAIFTLQTQKQIVTTKTDVEKVSFVTEDEVIIIGNYFDSKKANASSIILLHMLSRDKSSWDVFAEQLKNSGYNILAIDFRGHGESTIKKEGVINWQSFTEADFNKMVLDVKAAKEFLQKQKNQNKFVVIGASIGANIALNYAAQDKEIKAIVLLSPGLVYRGVTIGAIKDYKNPYLAVASNEDTNSVQAVQFLTSVAKGDTKIYFNAGHGTNIFSTTDLNALIISWVDEELK